MPAFSPTYRIGVNLGFAVNRYPEPNDWIEAICEIGVKRVQFVADLLNPYLPLEFRKKKTAEIQQKCDRAGIIIESAFTGAFTRVNHFGSEEKAIRDYWEKWFVEYARQSSEMGATTIGGHPGILSLKQDSNEKVRADRMEEIAERWHRVSEKVSSYGISQICWEPMSISRELGHTISDAAIFQEILESYSKEKFFLCLDLDHGDLMSKNTIDTLPTEWIKTFKSKIGMLHLKQTTLDRRRNMSFTDENNASGTVSGPQILNALKENKVNDLTMYLELGFRERNPDDYRAIFENQQSAEYWIKHGACL